MKRIRIRSVLLAGLTLVAACAGKKLNNVGEIGAGGLPAVAGTSNVVAGAGEDGHGGGGRVTTPSVGGVSGGGTLVVGVSGDTGEGPGGEGGQCMGSARFDCEPPHCHNYQQDLDEGGVDCGGSECSGCENGQLCQLDGDCVSGWCREGVCVQRCKRQSDCGGDASCQDGQCVDCSDSDRCWADCTGARNEAIGAVCACRAGISVCVAPSCDNGLEEGDEGDVDCGGSRCEPCDDGKGCEVSEDCASGHCVMRDWGDSQQFCFPASCNDHVLNGTETDVDCGGPSCPHCEVGRDCVTEDDCEYRFSCTDGACIRDCTPNGSEICGTLGECVDERCVECETTEDCANNCGLNVPLCHNRICQCAYE